MASLLLVGLPAQVSAQLATEIFLTGLNNPLALVQDPTQPNVQFVVEQFGRIRVVRDGALQIADFLDMSSEVAGGGEQGLLGLAFAPDYASSRRFFVNFTNTLGHTVIARFRRDALNALRADPNSRFDLIFPGGLPYIAQPFANHNGGDLHFGGDGFLYIGMGDGGSAYDPLNLAQDLNSLLGKMLRIDVNVPDGHVDGYTTPRSNPFWQPWVATGLPGSQRLQNLIWARGLRNPWRFSFDAVAVGGRGALIMGDVGQNIYEEVNYEPAGQGGRNYGWRAREGTFVVPGEVVDGPLTDPIIEYSRPDGVAIAGGVIYRGTDLGPSTFGRYFFGDLSGRVWSAALTYSTTGEVTASSIADHTADFGGTSVMGLVVAFGMDADCRLYIVNLAGTIRRVTRNAAGPAARCATPDPFIALGGGIFLTDGWVPPGHPLAGNTTPPPPPPPPPPPTATTCPGTAPVSDWLCVSGGWVPPNHPLAQSGTPPLPPPVPPTPSSCSGPDPFAGIPGMSGVCVNGGWIPLGHPLAGRRPGR